MRDHAVRVLAPPSHLADPRRDIRAVLAFGLASAALACALSAAGYSSRAADQVIHAVSSAAVSSPSK